MIQLTLAHYARPIWINPDHLCSMGVTGDHHTSKYAPPGSTFLHLMNDPDPESLGLHVTESPFQILQLIAESK